MAPLPYGGIQGAGLLNPEGGRFRAVQDPYASAVLARYGATSALASGILAALSAVFLVLFYAFEASALLESGSTEAWTPLGRTNDALVGLAVLAAIPAAFRLQLSWDTKASGSRSVSRVALGVALVSMVGLGLTQLAFAAGLVSSSVQGPIATLGLGGVGLWVLLVSLGRADPALGGRLRWIGVLTGVGNLLLPLAFFAAGGAPAIEDPQSVLASPLLLVGFMAGILSAEIGYPIWAIWLGRRLRAG